MDILAQDSDQYLVLVQLTQNKRNSSIFWVTINISNMTRLHGQVIQAYFYTGTCHQLHRYERI
jgi:hypothetical protein